LFGSKVRGDFDKDSDIDILIVVKKDLSKYRLEDSKEKLESSKLLLENSKYR